MRLKPGVKLGSLTPQMALAAIIVHFCYAERGAHCTITSANDGQHSTLSFHYKGNALDFRTKDFNGNKTALVAEIKSRLGADFDVILEDLGGNNEHLHLEFDQKE
jgi:hypothetical protein